MRQELIEITREMEQLLIKLGQAFRANAYKKAATSLENMDTDITKPEDLDGIPNIGSGIKQKLVEFIETGKIQYLEEMKNTPKIIFTNIYGIGPKKAEELEKKGLKNIDELILAYKENPSILNEKQKIGLQYYKDILERIPRDEITKFHKLLDGQVSPDTQLKFEIVGSYRRGMKNSGDIDVIFTTTKQEATQKEQEEMFKAIIAKLEKTGVITHILAQGKTKSLVIGKIPGSKYHRRIDFLHTTPEQYPFAVLYFTGSKYFNTAMRGLALKKGLSLNEHQFSIAKTGKPLTSIQPDALFKTEKDIFDYLDMEYKNPEERIDDKSVVIKKKQGIQGQQQGIQGQQQGIQGIQGQHTIQALTRYKKEGTVFLEKHDKTTLIEMVKEANNQYFNSQPVLTDNEYDILKEYIEEKYPDTEFEVGAELPKDLPEDAKVKLPYPMPSMNKKKTEKAIMQWYKDYPKMSKEKDGKTTSYILTAKLDGVSGMFYNETGTPKLFTRGNGEVGQDISHMIPYIKQLQPLVNKKITIRGELLLSKQVFKDKYEKRFANARNLVSGIVNQTKNVLTQENIEKYKDIDFVTYEVLNPVLEPAKQMKLISTINGENMELNAFYAQDVPTVSVLSEVLKLWRKDYIYEIDGIIVTHNKEYERTNKNPDHSFAFKMVLSDQTAETFVVDVIWSPSKDGYLKPRIRVDPVQVGGVTIEYTTGFNAAFIRDNKIGVGAKVKLIRSGDVIPYIEEVIDKASQAKMPPDGTYEWTETNIDIILKDHTSNKTVKAKNIEIFFKLMEVPDIGKGIATKLVESNFDTPEKVLKMTKEDFLTVESFKEKKAEKIHSNIQKIIYDSSNKTTDQIKVQLIRLMAASNLLGRGIAVKTIKSILDMYPDIITSNETMAEKMAKCVKVKGVAEKTCKPFVENIPKVLKFIETANLTHYLTALQQASAASAASAAANQPKGPTKPPHVITGFRNKELEQFLESQSIPVGATVNKKTQVLYINSPDYSNSKTDKAKELNIPIIVYKTTQELANQLKQMKIIE